MIEIEWSNAEKNVVTWKFIQPWTWDEFHNAKSQVDEMIDSVDGIVDSIFLTSRDQLMPPNATLHLRRIIAHRHNRHDLVVIVGANRFLSALLKVITRWIPGFSIQLRYALSQQQAFAIVEDAQKKRRQHTQDIPSNVKNAH